MGAGVAGAGAFFSLVAGAFFSAPGAVAGAAVVGAGVSGIAGFADGAGAVFAGVVTGVGTNVWSRIDLGARLRVDASDNRNARPRNRPPQHQLAFVRRLPVCRVPRNELAELLTPPKDAAIPPPCPA